MRFDRAGESRPARLDRWLERHLAPRPGDLLICAVSGGVDSVALLHLLLGSAARFGLRLEVAHVHHGLREGADADAEFVAALAERFGVPCHALRVDVRSEQQRRRAGLQDAARAARFDALGRLAWERRARALALGQHLDDQAETVLLRIARGTGLEGLTGIPPVRALPPPPGLPLVQPGPLVIRPLLGWSREELIAYCRQAGLGWREDPSNLDRRFRRVRLRLDVLPAFEAALGPGVARRVARLAESLRDDVEFLVAAGDTAFRESVRAEGPGRVELSVDSLRAAPAAARRRALRQGFARVAGDRTDAIGFDGVARLLELVQSGRDDALDLPLGVRARRVGDRLVLEGRRRPARRPLPERAVPVPGRLELPDLGGALLVRVERTPAKAEAAPPDRRNRAVFDWGAVRAAGPLVVRTWRPGDRIWLPHTDAPRRLARVFMHRRVPREMRARIPVLAIGQEVLWVVGVAASARFPVSSGTLERLELIWSER